MGKRLRWVFLSLTGLLLVVWVCFGYSTDPKITGLRNILHYKVVKALGGPAMLAGEPPGVLDGTVRGIDGGPLAGAVVL
ncbi:hypothetical protein ACFLYD_04195 [Chloroflexota bacterium]